MRMHCQAGGVLEVAHCSKRAAAAPGLELAQNLLRAAAASPRRGQHERRAVDLSQDRRQRIESLRSEGPLLGGGSAAAFRFAERQQHAVDVEKNCYHIF